MIKKLIDNFMNLFGYQIIRRPSLESRIKKGHYKWLSDSSISTVIDVGANDGGFALMINKILPDAAIYSFEPITEIFQKLQVNTSGISRIRLFNAALGEQESVKEFYINNFAPSSSFLEMKEQHIKSFPFTAESRKEFISIRTLDSFAPEMELKAGVLLKLDVQGYELNVLEGAKNILDRTNMVFIEVSFVELYDSQPLFNTVYNYLFERGFRYAGNFDQMPDPATNRILQADAIFIRD